MLFNSLAFLVFFPIVVGLYYVLPQRLRWVFLLLASIYFYIYAIPKHIILLVAITLTGYLGGIILEKTSGKQKIKYLILSISIPCILLFIFKYFDFFNENIAILAQRIHWNYPLGPLRILLPLGISFYAFRMISYVIEIYRENQKPEYHLGIFSLYISLFPQLIAGPIERPQALIPQLKKEISFDYQQVVDGLKLIAWGMFKKVVIADRLAMAVDPIYDNPEIFSGINFLFVAVLFSYQIYCDFSGYSDIAIGAGQVLGFKLTNNFKRPFYSKSMTEFWRRWHITLGSWLNGYIFTPIAIKRRTWKNYGIVYALMITFFLCGLWHGPNWTYIVFGLLHGIMISVEAITKKNRKKISYKIPPVIQPYLFILLTFSYTCLTFIVFKAANLTDAIYVITHLFSGFNEINSISTFWAAIMRAQFISNLVIALAGIFLVEVVHIVQEKRGSARALINQWPLWLRWTTYYSLIIVILLFGVSFGDAHFIYFQF